MITLVMTPVVEIEALPAAASSEVSAVITASASFGSRCMVCTARLSTSYTRSAAALPVGQRRFSRSARSTIHPTIAAARRESLDEIGEALCRERGGPYL